MADVLLWHKAFVNAKSKLGLTPLHLAAQNGYNELVRLLIETHGAVIDALSLVIHGFFSYTVDNYSVNKTRLLLSLIAKISKQFLGKTDSIAHGGAVWKNGGLQHVTENESRRQRYRCRKFEFLFVLRNEIVSVV